jgi:hypothetical protein
MKSRHGLRTPPFHTGKVAIGCAYTPKPPAPSRDAEQLQIALLDERTAARRTGLQRLFGFLWRLV